MIRRQFFAMLAGLFALPMFMGGRRTEGLATTEPTTDEQMAAALHIAAKPESPPSWWGIYWALSETDHHVSYSTYDIVETDEVGFFEDGGRWYARDFKGSEWPINTMAEVYEEVDRINLQASPGPPYQPLHHSAWTLWSELTGRSFPLEWFPCNIGSLRDVRELVAVGYAEIDEGHVCLTRLGLEAWEGDTVSWILRD